MHSFCVYVCACVVCMCWWVCGSLQVEARAWCIFLSLPHCCLRVRFLTGWEALRFFQAEWPENSLVCLSLAFSARVPGTHSHLRLSDVLLEIWTQVLMFEVHALWYTRPSSQSPVLILEGSAPWLSPTSNWAPSPHTTTLRNKGTNTWVLEDTLKL